MDLACPVGGPESSPTTRRLDSWKAIAAYFGRDARTVRRWERAEGLPVHRHLHRTRGSVYAFQEELDRWRDRRAAPIGEPAGRRRLFSGRNVALLAVASSMLGLTAWAFVPRDWTASRRTPTPAATARGNGQTSRWLADPQVRERFLLARHQLQRRSGFWKQALEHLEATVRRAPDFAEAHAWLGEAYLRGALFGPARKAESWRRAEASVRRALALDGSLSAAHTALSRILLLRDWNFSAAAAESLRAVALDPRAPEARAAHALFLRSVGRLEEAVAERERAQQADPLNPQGLVFLGDEYMFARRYEDARRTYHRALEVERDYRPAMVSLADVYARLDRDGEAATWQMRCLVLRPTSGVAAAFDDVRRRRGPRAAMSWLDARNLAEFGRAPDDYLWDLAYLHARQGNRDAALEFLERAYARREAGLLQARVDPDLDSLRADPRFQDLLERIGPR